MTRERIFHVAATPFEAARSVKILPEGHRSKGLHGHSFVARVRAELPAEWAAFPGDETDALRHRLSDCVAPLDYSSLNENVAVPTDENLARWVREQLDVPGVESIGIQSTRDQGADIDANNNVHVWRRFRFEAAHQLPNVPEGHQCGRMHGHGFEVILHANQDLGERDMGVDFDRLDEVWAPIHDQLHYACLNDFPGLDNPTSEMLSCWLWDRIKPVLPELSWVTVYETITAGCHYDGQRYRIWKEQRFESALRLLAAPEGDLRRQLHGHSYLVRLHLTAPLNTVMGWLVDYGDVKALFKPTYKLLDHRLLNELPELENADPVSVARWVKARLCPVLPQLDRIDLYSTPGCGAVLSWGEQGPALPT